MTSFQAPSASAVGEIKDASWSRDVTSVIFWPGVIWNGKEWRPEIWRLLKFFRIPITVVYFKDRKWIPQRVHCISCSVVCKIVFYSEFLDIPDNTGRVTRRRRRRRRRRTQATTKGYACHTQTQLFWKNYFFFQYSQNYLQNSPTFCL